MACASVNVVDRTVQRSQVMLEDLLRRWGGHTSQSLD
jgi:hypothetical protein